MCKHEHTREEAMLSCNSMKIDGSPEARSLPLRQTADQINGGAQGMRNKERKKRGERRRAVERTRELE